MAELLLVPAENLDAEVDADAEDHRDDRDGKNVEVSDRKQREAERPEHRHDEDEDGEGGAQEGAVADGEERDDQAHGDEAGLGGVVVGFLGLVGIERGLAGQFQFRAGILRFQFLEVLADLFRGVAEGRRGVLFLLAGVGEDEDGLAALETEVFVLGDQFVGVGVVGVFVVAAGILGRFLGEGLALGLRGDLVEERIELFDEGGEILPVFFVVQVFGIVKFCSTSVRTELRSSAICSAFWLLAWVCFCRSTSSESCFSIAASCSGVRVKSRRGLTDVKSIFDRTVVICGESVWR